MNAALIALVYTVMGLFTFLAVLEFLARRKDDEE